MSMVGGKMCIRDSSYTGFVYDNVNETNGAWYVRNGQIDFGANGFIKDPASDIYYYYRCV